MDPIQNRVHSIKECAGNDGPMNAFLCFHGLLCALIGGVFRYRSRGISREGGLLQY